MHAKGAACECPAFGCVLLPFSRATIRRRRKFWIVKKLGSFLAQAFLQEASVNAADCDIHFEISQTADKTAPRVIVETPVDSEYCSARQNAQSQLAKHGFRLDSQHGGELAQAMPVEITGMAFEDFEHNRGSAQVATIWELHPAILNIS